MSIKLSISEKEGARLVEYYTKRLSELQSEISEIAALIKQIQEAKNKVVNIEQNPLFSDLPEVNHKGYSPNWTWLQKAKYILRINGPSTTTDVVEAVIKEEPAWRDNREVAVRSLSSILGANAKEDGELVRNKNDRNDWVYSFK